MKSILILLLLSFGISNNTQSQNPISEKLDALFSSLEKRNEAMGSITILKNGSILYERAIGFRDEINGSRTPADINTNYKIWSITKTYVATMIFQLIEEEKLSLETTLDQFYPQIPNAEAITIRQMLAHRSGIFDYVNDIDEETRDTLQNYESTIDLIASFRPNFIPGTDFRYSNSNYLLLGHIIETQDRTPFETSLSNRILSKVGLTNTYFGPQSLENVQNKANTFEYNKQWEASPEEMSYNGHLSTADGGIVSTTKDMATFIEALFDGKLISKISLNEMLKGESSYRLGIMTAQYDELIGYGHTGGWISESSLFYYPDEDLTIAYATNGIVLPKEEILNYVLRIYDGKPFAVSMDKTAQTLLVLYFLLSLFIVMWFWFRSYLMNEYLVLTGFFLSALFWVGLFIAGYIHGEFSFVRDDFIFLNAFYSNSGSFFSIIEMVIAFLCIPFLIGLYRSCKALELSTLPILPVAFFSVSMIGVSIFPMPSIQLSISANLILASFFGPALAVLLWRKSVFRKLAHVSIIPVLLMIGSTVLMILRPAFPQFVHEYFGLIQKLFFLGVTFWLCALSLSFNRMLLLRPVDMKHENN
ncbi:MAG: serine hydrolase [Balneolaceae bacterium]